MEKWSVTYTTNQRAEAGLDALWFVRSEGEDVIGSVDFEARAKFVDGEGAAIVIACALEARGYRAVATITG